jgi:hypothetical protein
MQSTAIVMILLVVDKGRLIQNETKERPAFYRRALNQLMKSSLRLGFDDFATTVKTSGADVVTQMNFTCGGFQSDAGHGQGIV